MFKYQNEFTTASARGLFDYDHNDTTRKNGAKLVKHFDTSVVQHFYHIKMTTTWNTLPNEDASSRTMISFKNSLDKYWAVNPPMSVVAIIDAAHNSRVHKQSNSRRPACCWKWTKRSVLLLLRLLPLLLVKIPVTRGVSPTAFIEQLLWAN